MSVDNNYITADDDDDKNGSLQIRLTSFDRIGLILFSLFLRPTAMWRLLDVFFSSENFVFFATIVPICKRRLTFLSILQYYYGSANGQ